MLSVPSPSVMKKQSYGKKFLLIATAFIVPIVLTSGFLIKQMADGVQQTRQERMGAEYIHSLKSFYHAAERFQEDWKYKQDPNTEWHNNTDKAVEAVDAMDVAYGKTLGTSAKWSDIKNRLNNATEADNLNGVFQDTLTLISDIGDSSGLDFDSHPETSYLRDASIARLPLLYIQMDSMGASLADYAKDRELSSSEKLKTQHFRTVVQDAYDNLKTDMSTAYAHLHNQALKDKLDSSYLATKSKIDNYLQFIDSQVLSKEGDVAFDGSLAMAKSPTPVYQVSGVQPFDTVMLLQSKDDAILASKELSEATSDALAALLDARLQLQTIQICVAALVSVLAVILVGYLLLSMYLGTRRVIKDLQRISGNLANGDLTVRVPAETKHELGGVGEAFNQMADGFMHLIKQVQGNSKEVASAIKQSSSNVGELFRTSEAVLFILKGLGLKADEINERVKSVTEISNELSGYVQNANIIAEQIAEPVARMTTITEHFNDTVESIVKSSNELNGCAQDTARSVEDMNGSITTANQNVDQLTQSIQRVGFSITDIKNSAQYVTDASQHIVSSVKSVSEMSHELNESVQFASLATRGMSSAAHSVAESIEVLSTSLNQISQNAVETTHISSDALNSARAAEKTINGLETNLRAMSNVVGLIKSLSDQMQSLAGRVANETEGSNNDLKNLATEIKMLATRTCDSTELIRNQINIVQASTGSSFQAVQGFTKHLDDIKRINKTITDTVNEQSATTIKACETIRCTAETADEVVNNIQNLSDATQTIGSSVQNIIDMHTHVNNNLRNVVSGTDTLYSSLSSVTHCAGEVQHHIHEIGNNISNLGNKIWVMNQFSQDVGWGLAEAGKASGEITSKVRTFTYDNAAIHHNLKEIARTSIGVRESIQDISHTADHIVSQVIEASADVHRITKNIEEINTSANAIIRNSIDNSVDEQASIQQSDLNSASPSPQNVLLLAANLDKQIADFRM